MTDHASLQQHGYKEWLKVVRTQIIQHVQNRTSHYYPELAGSQRLHVGLAREPRQKRYTVIFDLEIKKDKGMCVKRLIAKAYRPKPKRDASNEEHVFKSRYEFEMHQKVYERFQTPSEDFLIIKPCDYIPELLCLIIERAEGQDLGTLIHQTRYAHWQFDRRKQMLGTCFERAGKWLASFHSGFASDDHIVFESPHFEKQFQLRLDGLANSGVPALYLNPLQQRLKPICQALAGKPLQQTLLHGDLKPCHIFISKDLVIPIDFGNVLAGVNYDEVARMLAEIKMIDFGAVAPVHANLDGYLQNRFLKGYFGEEAWQPLVRFYYIVWLSAKWLRRLHKHKWMLHPVVKKTELLVRKLAIKDFVNRAYVTPWFYTFLVNALDILEKEIL